MTDLKIALTTALTVVALCMAGGCDAAPEHDRFDDDESGAFDDESEETVAETTAEVFTVTRIELTPTGVGRVEVWETTRAEQLREAENELAGRIEDDSLGQSAQAISSRTSCASTDFRLWTETNYTGSTLCFYGTYGSADLDDYTYRYGSGPIYAWLSWAGAVNSYKAGDYTGTFSGNWAHCGSPYVSAAANSSDTDFPNSYDHFVLGQYGCIPN